MANHSEKPYLVRAERTPVRNYDLYDGLVTEVYVDGLSDGLIGPFTTKLTFHITESVEMEEGSDVPVEKRRRCLRITIPTSALLEATSFLTTNVALNSEVLASSTDQLAGQFRLSSLPTSVEHSK